MIRSRQRTISVAVTSRRLALVGFASIRVILAGMVISAIPYRGYESVADAPLDHFVSELGEIAVSRLAWAFMAVYSTYIGTDAAGRLLNRPGPFWNIACLEWASLLGLLAWFAFVSLVLLREPAE